MGIRGLCMVAGLSMGQEGVAEGFWEKKSLLAVGWKAGGKVG